MFRVTTEWTGPQQGTPYYSTLYTGGVGQADADAAVAAIDDFWVAMAGAITTDLNWNVQPEVEEVDPPSGQVLGITTTPGAIGNGTDTGDELPFTTQGLVRWRTGTFVGGREIRGRTYIPGPTEGVSQVGRPTGAYFNALAAAASALVTAGSTFGSLVVYSPTRGMNAVVTGSSPWGQWAVLRSRRD